MGFEWERTGDREWSKLDPESGDYYDGDAGVGFSGEGGVTEYSPGGFSWHDAQTFAADLKNTENVYMQHALQWIKIERDPAGGWKVIYVLHDPTQEEYDELFG